MNLEKLQKQLNQAQRRLSAIESDLAQKETEYTEAENSYAEILGSYSHVRRKPKAVSTQRERTLRLKVEVEALTRAKGIYQDKTAEAQRNVALCELYQDQGQHYLDRHQEFAEQTKALVAAAARMRTAIETFTEVARGFFENPAGPIDLLRSFATNPLFANVSVESFLDGKIKETENQENAGFLDKQEKKLLQMASSLPPINEHLLDELQWAVGALVQFASNPASATKRAYVPPDKRPQQAIKTQTSLSIPRHARGGPDQDESEDYHSDYWVRRRVALRSQATPATKVLGPAPGVKSNV